MKKVLITDSIHECVRDILKPVAKVDILPTMSEKELLEIIQDYDVLMVRSATKVTEKIINASRLKIIARAGVGLDNIDVVAAKQKDILVLNSPDGNTIAAAEHTLALLFAVTRNLSQAFSSTASGKWERSNFLGRELYGKTLGIVGFGRIGQHVGKVAKALGMRLVVFDPYADEQKVQSQGARYFKELESMLPECDYLTLHVPKTKETTHLINQKTIALMKKGSFIINCSRGGIIDETALKEALSSGQIAGAGLDVYESEPDITKSPIFGMKNVSLTPHIGASTKEAQEKVAIDVANQVKTILEKMEA